MARITGLKSKAARRRRKVVLRSAKYTKVKKGKRKLEYW